jgi:hypothetical protein
VLDGRGERGPQLGEQLAAALGLPLKLLER